MKFTCILTTEQREFLNKAYELWAGQRGFYEYRRSFDVLKNVLGNCAYYEVQLPYINNVRDWYIGQLKQNK